MEKHPINDLMEKTMSKIRELVDANTIVGEPIVTQDGITLIPVSKLSFGFASGGSDFPSKAAADKGNFGGGGGAGVKIDPVAFLVVNNGSVKMISVTPQPMNTIEKILDSAPELMDKVSDFIAKKKEEDAAKENL